MPPARRDTAAGRSPSSSASPATAICGPRTSRSSKASCARPSSTCARSTRILRSCCCHRSRKAETDSPRGWQCDMGIRLVVPLPLPQATPTCRTSRRRRPGRSSNGCSSARRPSSTCRWCRATPRRASASARARAQQAVRNGGRLHRAAQPVVPRAVGRRRGGRRRVAREGGTADIVRLPAARGPGPVRSASKPADLREQRPRAAHRHAAPGGPGRRGSRVHAA